MPVNFLNAPVLKPDYEGYENFFGNILKNYQGGVKHKLDTQQGQQRLSEAEMKNALLKKFGEPREQAEIDFLRNKALASQHLPEQALADIALTRAQEYEKFNPRTAAQVELQQAFQGDQEGMSRALRRKYGAYDSGRDEGMPDNVPEEVIGQPLEALPKNAQSLERKEMQSELKKAINMSETIPLLDDLERLVDEHPTLWKSASLMLNAKSPDELTGVKDVIKKQLINEKEKTAIDKFAKITSTLISKGGEALGSGQRLTDARQSLIASMKPEVSNTPEANRYIIQGMKKLMSAGPNMEQAYRWGLKNNVSILNNPEAFRSFKKRAPQDNQQFAGQEEALMQKNRNLLNQQNGGKMITITNDRTGETKVVTEEEARSMGAI